VDYRIYLISDSTSIRAADNFSAASDGEAMEVATALCDAAGDSFERCELWRGTTLVTQLCPNAAGKSYPYDGGWLPGGSLFPLSHRQEQVLALEERLQQSFGCIRASRQFMQAFTELFHRR
jgi:hypothetical protein